MHQFTPTPGVSYKQKRGFPPHSQLHRRTGGQLRLVGEAERTALEASLLGEFQHLRHHGPDAVVNVVECRLAHESRGRDHLVLLVHVRLVHSS